MNFKRIILFIFGVIISSCEPVDDAVKYEEKIVVFGNLKANEGMMDTIYVSRTYKIEQAHEQEANWITDAEVAIRSGSGIYPFGPVQHHPGRYTIGPRSGWNMVHPNETYELSVKWMGHNLSSQTVIPDTLHIQSVQSTSYQCDGEQILIDPINLYLGDNTMRRIQYAMKTGDFSTLKMDTVTYREGSCYTTSFASIPMFVITWEAERDPGMIRLVSDALEDTPANAIVDTSLSAHIFKGHMARDIKGDYYWPNPIVWHLSQESLDFGWLSFNYTGVHLIEIQVADESFRKYFKGFLIGPPQIQYILPESNIEGGYGLFSSTHSIYFLVYVKTEE